MGTCEKQCLFQEKLQTRKIDAIKVIIENQLQNVFQELHNCINLCMGNDGHVEDCLLCIFTKLKVFLKLHTDFMDTQYLNLTFSVSPLLMQKHHFSLIKS